MLVRRGLLSWGSGSRVSGIEVLTRQREKDKALKAGKGDGNPLQCSCLKNPRDGGAWGAAVCGVAQSDTTEAT